ncbi:MAG: glycoside hydrolase family 97 catalytic domain-containing protein [Sedimentisphaerales bacterium]|nr:glycoside hydrolase family 97 catalytic domain-containing protein [Sedimentisphaerales bacterium]
MERTFTSLSITTVCFFLFYFSESALGASTATSSPDGQLQVDFQVDSQGRALYSIKRAGKVVIAPSQLGLVLNNQSFTDKLSLESIGESDSISEKYRMLLGKRKNCFYQAHRRTFNVKNDKGETMQIVFQVSNDGVAFRYGLPEASDKILSVEHEISHFTFAPTTVSWLHPMQPGKSGWSQTQPSYEEHYVSEQPVGQPSPFGAGWCLPALFKTPDDIWVLICDSDVDENYCAIRLAHDSAGGTYKVAFPDTKEHRGEIDPIQPGIKPPFKSPWRVVIIGESLKTLVESTLMTDVAAPCEIEDTDFIRPGRAAWHWLRYGDDSATLDVADSFLDFAAKMKWEYLLVDANWDKFIGYEKMAEFVKKASQKNVGVILWYNSNGIWNNAPMGPRNKMHERTVRRDEFARLKKMGVKGVKVDFFGGDKQATMKLYRDTFKDAADYQILVNCHGATIPRGWQRTFPNLVTMEAVRGMEYCTFSQDNADRQAWHSCILPFTRNVIGSMDFTPTVFNPHIRQVKLQTTPGFELATSVIFESGIQHFGLVPDEYQLMPDFVVEFLQAVPTVWDETHFVDGYPGQYTVIARKSDDVWYIAGINGTKQDKSVTLDLAFVSTDTTMRLITDGPDRTFTQKTLDRNTTGGIAITIQPYGGFIIVAVNR